jgi:hypothetical protein
MILRNSIRLKAYDDVAEQIYQFFGDLAHTCRDRSIGRSVPPLLMKGSPLLIMVDILAAALGIWLVAAAVMGYSIRRLRILERCAYVLAGVCVFLPAAVQPSARWINLAGLIFVGCIAAWHRWGPSAAKASAPAADQNESLPRDAAALPKNEREALEKMGVMGTIEGA